MAKRVFMVHCWGGFPENHWFPWLKHELERKGFTVIIPAMPNPEYPDIHAWVSHLKKVVGTLDKDTSFIGHSIGCQTIMRLLETTEYTGKIGKTVFVAGWFKLDNLEDEDSQKIAQPWSTTPIHFDKVKRALSTLTVFLSSNEPYGHVEYNTKTFKEKLNAKIIIEKNKGHFTAEDGVTELPEVLKEFNTT